MGKGSQSFFEIEITGRTHKLGSEEGVEKAGRRKGVERRKKMAKEVGSGGVATEEDERSTKKK